MMRRSASIQVSVARIGGLAEEAREPGSDGSFESFDQRIAGPLLRRRLNRCQLAVCETFQTDQGKTHASAATADEPQGGQVPATQLELLPSLGARQLAHGSLKASAVGA